MNHEYADTIKNILHTDVYCLVPPYMLNHLWNDVEFIDAIFIDDECEPLVYYFVSNWLGEKLKDKKELVFNVDTCFIWASCEWGNPLHYHHALISIAKDLKQFIM